MRIPLCGRWPKRSLLSAARLCVIGLAGVVLGGCATNREPSYVQGPAIVAPQGQTVHNQAVEVEDDGRPAQVAPSTRRAPLPDDPSEPWSPNYGGPPAAEPAPATRENTPARSNRRPRKEETAADSAVPGIQPARLSAGLSDVEADAIMQKAIGIHEMRH